MQSVVTEFKLLRDPARPSSAVPVGPVLESAALRRAADPSANAQVWPSPNSKEAERVEGVASALSLDDARDAMPFNIVQGASSDKEVADVCAVLHKLSGALADSADELDAEAIQKLIAEWKPDRDGGGRLKYGGLLQDVMPAIGDAVVLLLLWKVVDHEHLVVNARRMSPA